MTTDPTARQQPTHLPSRATTLGVAAASVVAGALLALTVVLHALEPAGCIGEQECAIRPMRSISGVTAALGATALVLLVIALAGIILIARRSGRKTTPGSAGVICLATGSGALVVSGIVQTIFFSGDFPWMPVLVLPAMIAVIVGVILIAVSSIRSGSLPPWLGILLAVSAASLIAVNEQTALVLFALPLALTMVVVGIHVTRSPAAHGSIPRASRT